MSPDASSGRFTSRSLLKLVLLSAFTGVGLIASAAMVVDWLQALDTWSWDETACTVLSSRVVQRRGFDDHALEVAYRYRYRGVEYAGDAYRHAGAGFDEIAAARREAARYVPGETVSCWVDPDEPSRSYLRRANLWRGLLVLIPLVFVALGGGLLWLFFGPAPGTARPLAERLRALRSPTFLVGFFGLFLLAGLGLLVPLFVLPALQVIDARSWRPVPCEIVSSSVRAHSGEGSTTYSVDVLYRYEVGGREHLSDRYHFLDGSSSSGRRSKAEAVARMPEGAEITCWVNPDDPFDAVVERGFTPELLFGLFPLIFVAAGAGGIGFTVVAARGMKDEAARPSWPRAPGGVGPSPRADAADDGSGPLVLEPQIGRLGKLGCATVVALAWNGFVALFVWQIAESWRAGDPQWFPALVLLPFVLVGLLLLASIPYGLLALANPRPRLRLSRGAIRVAEPTDVAWTFRGAAERIRRLRMSLEATRITTEVTTHDRGVSVRTRSEPVREVEILDRGRDQPLEFGAVSFTLPEDAPPTSRGDETLSWKLKLHGEIDYWPDVSEEYELRVLPPPQNGW